MNPPSPLQPQHRRLNELTAVRTRCTYSNPLFPTFLFFEIPIPPLHVSALLSPPPSLDLPPTLPRVM